MHARQLMVWKCVALHAYLFCILDFQYIFPKIIFRFPTIFYHFLKILGFKYLLHVHHLDSNKRTAFNKRIHTWENFGKINNRIAFQ